jgi:uncharacterized protein YdeI (YjbR/CyaY-like superfamily)
MKKVTVDEYILNSGKWEEALILLREILRETGLEETVKWGMPHYTLEGKNVIGMAAFKSYAGLWFLNGALLKDAHKVLHNAGEGETTAQRQWRFGSVDEIRDNVDILIDYIEEAIENQRRGRVVPQVKKKPYSVPEELQREFDNDERLRLQFESLSHGKKRDYCRYIGRAKRPETRTKRLKESLPLIREGLGLMDKYR